MKNETRELIEQLAVKLGTTTEYLWSVIIKQAPIYAISSIIELLIIIIMGILLFKIHKKMLIERHNNRGVYYEYEGRAVIPLVIATILWCLFFLFSCLTLNNVITNRRGTLYQDVDYKNQS